MSTSFTESIVEEAALTWLEGLGYVALHGPDIAASVVPYYRYLCITTETMEQYRHDLH